MDRQQKIKKLNSKGHVFKISDLKPTTEFLSPEYSLKVFDEEITETGKLEVFEVVARSGNGPDFVGRWDQKARCLDIDMRNAPAQEIRDFKNSKNGYGGHHPSNATDRTARTFDVRISIPTGTIFCGKLSFANHHRLLCEPANYSITGNSVALATQPKDKA